MGLKGVASSVFKFKISLLGYRIIITWNHEVLERGKYPPIFSVFKIVLGGKGEDPPIGGE